LVEILRALGLPDEVERYVGRDKFKPYIVLVCFEIFVDLGVGFHELLRTGIVAQGLDFKKFGSKSLDSTFSSIPVD